MIIRGPKVWCSVQEAEPKEVLMERPGSLVGRARGTRNVNEFKALSPYYLKKAGGQGRIFYRIFTG